MVVEEAVASRVSNGGRGGRGTTHIRAILCFCVFFLTEAFFLFFLL